MAKKTALIVDDYEGLLDSMREFFELSADVHCLCFLSLKALTAEWGIVSKSAPSVAILDVNLGVGQPSGVDVYYWLRSQGYQGQVVFLTGHAKDHPLVKEAVQINGVKVFEKPMDIEKLVTVIKEA